MIHKNMFLLALCAGILVSLGGCKQEAAEQPDNTSNETSKMISTIESQLADKYGDQFDVISITSYPSHKLFHAGSYEAEVKSDQYSGTFSAEIDSTGNGLKDNYPILYWDDDIDDLIKEIVINIPEIRQIGWRVIYSQESECWSSSDKLSSYLSQSNTYILMNLDLGGEDLDVATDILFRLTDRLRTESIHFVINCTYQNIRLNFSEKKDMPAFGREEIQAMLENALSKGKK